MAALRSDLKCSRTTCKKGVSILNRIDALRVSSRTQSEALKPLLIADKAVAGRSVSPKNKIVNLTMVFKWYIDGIPFKIQTKHEIQNIKYLINSTFYEFINNYNHG